MSEIIYPSVDLFVYQLESALGASEEKTKADAGEFLANFPSEYQDKVAEAVNSPVLSSSDLVPFFSKPNHIFCRSRSGAKSATIL